ncbi:hypothetical protein KKF70_03820 [bacterium]|nr:hypothetical protein [Candidatus Omnitrophota bacterium]MBU2528500.1 hypothetical protein [bacterium]MBU3930792.1 hypothetical protein [bacterium]MBU4122423.1 hypothetical protein [bacterium]
MKKIKKAMSILSGRKNSILFTKKEREKEKKYLRSLSFEKSAAIVENLITCRLGRDILEANKKWNKK